MFDFEYFLQSAWVLAPSLPLTFFIAFISFVLGGVLGFIMALCKIYRIIFFSQISVIIVSFFRGTPLLVQLFMFYYGIPQLLQSMDLPIDISSVDALYYAILVFSLYASAYLCEIFRAAILSVDKGQREAAYSIGMSEMQALRRIIMPQALMSTLPNLLNFFIMQIKNTSLCSVITIPELMGLADIESARTSQFLEVYFMAALMYWGMCVCLEAIFFRLERFAMRYKKEYK